MEPLTLLALVAGAGLLASGRRGPPGTAGPVQISRGTITGPLGTYRLTRGDVLWLGRAVAGEVSDRASDWATAETRRGGAAVLWALASNMLLVRRATPIRNMTRLARAYAQPINPKWASRESSGCRRIPRNCTPRRLRRRRRFRTMTWSQLPEGIRQLVTRWAAGEVPNPIPGMVDWSAPHFSGARVEIAGNWFGVGSRRRLAVAGAEGLGFVTVREVSPTAARVVYWGVMGGGAWVAYRLGHYAITGGERT